MKKNFAVKQVTPVAPPLLASSGFTLAEVLITLAIIGIVAALTIPTLIAKYKEKQNISKLNKVYSTISQVMSQIVNEYGSLDTWNLTPTVVEEGVAEATSMNIIAERFGKHIKHERLDPNWSDNIPQTNMHNVAFEYMLKSWPASMTLADGTILMIGMVYPQSNCSESDFTKNLSICSSIVVWFPDSSKKRIEGVNQFNFYILKDRIIPWGLPEDGTNSFEESCDITQNVRNSGRGCTAWVLTHKNMDYLHCEGLKWNGKTKCK